MMEKQKGCKSNGGKWRERDKGRRGMKKRRKFREG
jgi:hypothetical protein